MKLKSVEIENYLKAIEKIDLHFDFAKSNGSAWQQCAWQNQRAERDRVGFGRSAYFAA